jgi:hypothetical protein
MTKGFTFNFHRYNLWPVYEAIAKYYPIGIPREKAIYSTYPGRKALEKIALASIHDTDTYEKVWGSFEKVLESNQG